MKTIDIQINRAKLLSYSVSLEDGDMPTVSATVGLFAGEKKISEFSLRTQNYYANSVTFEVPVSMVGPILKIAEELETILVRATSQSIGELPSGEIV